MKYESLKAIFYQYPDDFDKCLVKQVGQSPKSHVISNDLREKIAK